MTALSSWNELGSIRGKKEERARLQRELIIIIITIIIIIIIIIITIIIIIIITCQPGPTKVKRLVISHVYKKELCFRWFVCQ